MWSTSVSLLEWYNFETVLEVPDSGLEEMREDIDITEFKFLLLEISKYENPKEVVYIEIEVQLQVVSGT